MNKLVAVSQRIDEYPDRNERRDALDQRLNAWLNCGGYISVPVPNNLCGPAQSTSDDRQNNLLMAWLKHLRPRAIVLSGGNDIGSCLERDRTESQLLNWAKIHQLPVLGICRGMQMMSVEAGGNLMPIEGHVRATHNLQGEISGPANSYHNIALGNCPAGYEVLATSEDGGVEAIRHKDFGWEGWMWHPERDAEFATRDLNRLRRLFGE